MFAGFEWWSETYLLSGRADDDEQLFYYEKRFPAGVRVHVRPNWVLDVAAGRATKATDGTIGMWVGGK